VRTLAHVVGVTVTFAGQAVVRGGRSCPAGGSSLQALLVSSAVLRRSWQRRAWVACGGVRQAVGYPPNRSRARACHISVDRRSDSTSTRSSSPWNMRPNSSKVSVWLNSPNP